MAFLKPNIRKIGLGVCLFVIFQLIDLRFGFGGGFGFPVKFFALGLNFGAGFFSVASLIIDLLFFYILSAIFLYSKVGKIVAISLLLVTFLWVDKPYRGFNFFKSSEELRMEFREECEALGLKWTVGDGDTLGTCQ